jgi:hypothetical protein
MPGLSKILFAKDLVVSEKGRNFALAFGEQRFSTTKANEERPPLAARTLKKLTIDKK